MKPIGDQIKKDFPELSPHWDKRDRKKTITQEVNPEYLNKVLNPEKNLKKVSFEEALQLWRHYADIDTQQNWQVNYQFTKENQKLIEYMMNQLISPEFKRGFFLMGKTGTGKSAIMRIFSSWLRRIYNLQHLSYSIASTIDIVSEYSEGGEDAIARYKIGNWCFDDLGAENLEAMFMGNRKNVMKDLLQIRYNNHRAGMITHITSNINKEQFGDYYGFRMASRLNEMFQVKVLGGDREAVDFRELNVKT